MVLRNFRVVQASAISALLLVSVISIIQWSAAQVNVTDTFSANLMPRTGSNGTGKATLELQGPESVKYTVTASGLQGRPSGVVISEMNPSGRAPDVVALKEASLQGLGPENGTATGNFTTDDLIGPLEGKQISDLVKAIDSGKIIFRIMTEAFPLGEVIGNVTAGTAGGNMTVDVNDIE